MYCFCRRYRSLITSNFICGRLLGVMGDHFSSRIATDLPLLSTNWQDRLVYLQGLDTWRLCLGTSRSRRLHMSVSILMLGVGDRSMIVVVDLFRWQFGGFHVSERIHSPRNRATWRRTLQVRVTSCVTRILLQKQYIKHSKTTRKPEKKGKQTHKIQTKGKGYG